jgi:MFS transporter, SHS family, sialic acid transporter
MATKTTERAKWLALAAAFLGWMFDGMEMGIFPLVAKPALKSMGEDPAGVDQWMSIITALFLVGAACGGLVFGWLGDRIGRVRSMTWSILCYSLFSGACYFATEPWHLGLFRCLAALGMGGEWSLGVALVMEIWPSEKRPLMAAFIGAAANIGYCVIASIKIVFEIGDWRTIMIIGAAPALLTFLIRLFVPESEKWVESVSKQKATPLRDIFSPELRKNTLLAICFAGIVLVVTWGTVQWIPLWAGELAGESNKFAGAWSQLFSALGATTGCLLAPFVGQLLGRRWAYFVLCVAALIACQIFYGTFGTYGNAFLMMAFVVGCCSASFYGWLPLYLPELFPTRSRATGQGVAFNTGRIIAAIGTLNVSTMIQGLGGYAKTGMVISCVYLLGMVLIWFAPETKNRPLPE